MKTPLLIENPVGIDRAIQSMQIWIANRLTWIEQSYGRAYINDKKQPECYIGNNEYFEVFGNDKSNAFSFFATDSEIEYISSGNTKKIRQNKTNVSIVFFVDLQDVFTEFSHRADENAAKSAESIIDDYFSQFANWKFKKVIRTPQKVYNRYDWSFTDSSIDNQPYTVFAFEMELTYDSETYCIP
jgi:hypothetical protein